MSKNPFEAMAKIYKEGVERGDAKGCADKFKKASELFFVKLAAEGYHAEDIEYGDGYFIFGWGTNSTLQFHIKECPEWLFGIWWDLPAEDEDDKPTLKNKIKKLFKREKLVVPRDDVVNGTFFGQFEEAIDKFKPSYSEITAQISICIEDLSYSSDLWSLARKLKFVKENKELAFCREVYYWDYNTEYHTKQSAIKKYNTYKENKLKVKQFKEDAKKEFFDLYKTKLGPHFPELKFNDRGESWSPRYRLIIPAYSLPFEIKQGYYNWPGLLENLPEEDLLALEAEVKKAEKELNDKYSKLFRDREDYFFTVMHSDIGVIDVTKEEYDKIKDCYYD